MGVDQHLVSAQTELAGPLSGLQHGRRAEERPVQAGFFLEQVEELPRAARSRFPFRREVGLVDELLPGRYLQAPRPPTTSRRLMPAFFVAAMIAFPPATMRS